MASVDFDKIRSKKHGNKKYTTLFQKIVPRVLNRQSRRKQQQRKDTPTDSTGTSSDSCSVNNIAQYEDVPTPQTTVPVNNPVRRGQTTFHVNQKINPFYNKVSQSKRTTTWAPQIVKRAATLLPPLQDEEQDSNGDELAQVLKESVCQCNMLDMVNVIKQEIEKVNHQNSALQKERDEARIKLGKIQQQVARHSQQCKSPSFIQAVRELHLELTKFSELNSELKQMQEEVQRMQWRLRASEAGRLISQADCTNKGDDYLTAQLTLLMFAGLVKCN